ncbi:hypothetical protein CEXT_316771 [Caerostris extrusa]|uniref:Uncharacterized protein n=1 Tax=Caerostris extrusa TaxID=172846 RepID=A0AAV4WV84_CAEEX|nr:hypothetical protein CEXT_316771 [Caerostris extrusa]
MHIVLCFSALNSLAMSLATSLGKETTSCHGYFVHSEANEYLLSSPLVTVDQPLILSLRETPVEDLCRSIEYHAKFVTTFCWELGDVEDKNWNWLEHLSHFQELIPYEQVSNSPP